MGQSQPLKRWPVLIVEDEPILRIDAISMVEKAGFEAVEALSSADAIRILEERLDIRLVYIFSDGEATGAAMKIALAAEPDLLVTTGGTGLRPDDRTPEVTRPLLEAEVPGIGEAIRAAGMAKGVPTAMLSRGLAGVVGGTLVVNLPGSTGGVRDALDVLEDVVTHAVDQLRGGDH